MKKKSADNDWQKVNKLTKTVTFPSWTKKAGSIFCVFIFTTVAVISIFFGIDGLSKYFEYSDLHFNGNWIPSQNYCDFMKKIGIDLPICKEYTSIDLANIKIRDTDYEQYGKHNVEADVDNYTGSDAEYDVVGNHGEIKSNNLRFEYVYNQIVGKAINYSNVFPDMSDAYVTGVYTTSNASQVNADHFLQIDDVTENHISGTNLWGVKIKENPAVSDDEALFFSLPIFIYNNSQFLTHLSNFYLSYFVQSSAPEDHQAFVQGQTSKSVLVPIKYLDSTDSEYDPDPEAINTYLYDYFEIMVNNIYKYHIQEFQPWDPYNSDIDDVNFDNNPFQNFALELIEPETQTANFIYNPNNPDNVLNPKELLKLTPDQVNNENNLISIFFLPPNDDDSDGNYDYTIQSIIKIVNDSGYTLNEFIDIINDVREGNVGKLSKLIRDIPQLSDMKLLPFQALQPLFSYDGSNNNYSPVVFNMSGITGRGRYSLSPATNSGRIDSTTTKFSNTMINFWNGILWEPYSTIDILENEPSSTLSTTLKLSQNELLNDSSVDFIKYVDIEIKNKIYDNLKHYKHTYPKQFRSDLPDRGVFKQEWKKTYEHSSSNDESYLPTLHFFDNNHDGMYMQDNYEWLYSQGVPPGDDGLKNLQENASTFLAYYSINREGSSYKELLLNFRIIWVD